MATQEALTSPVVRGNLGRTRRRCICTDTSPPPDTPVSLVVRVFRPYVLLTIAWFLSTNHVSQTRRPRLRGPPNPGSDVPQFSRGWCSCSPCTMFYTMVLASLFSMAWMEFDERFGGRDPEDEMQCKYFYRTLWTASPS